MRKWLLVPMVVVMLAAPMLACGFPLPTGTQTAAPAKIVCADAEPAESCQLRQDAYELMNNVESVSVPDLAMSLNMDDGTQVVEMTVTGSFDYVVTDSDEGLGADVHLVMDEAVMTSEGTTETFENAEVIVIGNQVYTSEDGGETWEVQEMDEDTLLGLGMILGLSGATGGELNLFTEPTVFSVSALDDVQYDGKTLKAQQLQINLTDLLLSEQALTNLMGSGMMASDDLGMGDAAGDMDPGEMAMMAGMMLPFLEGTDFVTTLHINPDDGYIYYVEDNYVFQMDMSAMDPDAGMMVLSYELAGHLTQHNQVGEIVAPEGAVEGEGGLFDDSGLGDSLFGG
jgi:hypothetical protein